MSLPGVRNRIYQSPTYGCTLVWEHEHWQAIEATTEGGIDRLALRNPGDQSEPAENRLDIDISPLPPDDNPWLVRLQAEFAAMLDGAGRHFDLREPTANQLSFAGKTELDGAVTGWEGYCPAIVVDSDEPDPPDPYCVFLLHTTSAPGDEQSALAGDVVASIQPHTPGWRNSYPDGVIDVYVIEEEPERNDETFTLKLALKNVDDKGATFDPGKLLVNGDVPPDNISWDDGGTDGEPRLIPIDSAIAGRFTFNVAGVAVDFVCYEQQTGCHEIADFTKVVGTGGRPRIDPGR